MLLILVSEMLNRLSSICGRIMKIACPIGMRFQRITHARINRLFYHRHQREIIKECLPILAFSQNAAEISNIVTLKASIVASYLIPTLFIDDTSIYTDRPTSYLLCIIHGLLWYRGHDMNVVAVYDVFAPYGMLTIDERAYGEAVVAGWWYYSHRDQYHREWLIVIACISSASGLSDFACCVTRILWRPPRIRIISIRL